MADLAVRRRGPAGSRRHRPCFVHHLHVRHHRPRQGRPAVAARHAVDRRRVLGADLRAEREGRRPFAAAAVPFLRPQSFGAQRSRRRRERAHHGEDFRRSRRSICCRPGSTPILPGVPTMFHYLLHRAQESGVERLGAISALHLRRRDHARDPEPGVRGALQDAAAWMVTASPRRPRWSP